MHQTYTHISVVLFQHRYFSDNIFKSLTFSYSNETAALIRNLGIIIKPFAGGFHLLASNPELLNSKIDDTPIQIYLNCSDPYYINYTGFPAFRLSEYLLYFNNLSVDSIQQGQILRLHNEDFVGEKDLAQVSHGQIPVPGPETGITYRVLDAGGNDLEIKNSAALLKKAPSFIIPDIQQGFVRVISQNKEEKRFYYNADAVWKKPLGILEIYCGNLFTHFKKSGKVEYILNFNNRQTIWKYFLVSPVYKNFNNLSIVSKGKDQLFNSPQKQLIQNNLEALVFESKNKIALLEHSGENFQLVDGNDNGNGKSKIILKNLAKPSPEQLFMDASGSDGAIYSHIYI